jgi:hypothetical protein
MRRGKLVLFSSQGVALLLVSAYSTLGYAACSVERIERMATQGRTVATIARTCKMDAEEVLAILEEQDIDPSPPPDDDQGKLPAGAPVGQCGCWGPVDPQYEQPHPMCLSGYATPRMCNAVCPAGGFMWQGVCT